MFCGFKLHVFVDHKVEIMAVCLVHSNENDRHPVPKLFRGLRGLVAGNTGCISKSMVEELALMGDNFITKTRPNMGPVRRLSFEKFFLAKRTVVEAVIGKINEDC